ncbi:hypothetical protein BDW74DRAFT_78984 [Aspergillus multicolor]|uniref:uncharacterized protein n=1 Tax=Aspergillus multicolor TaxID=41759 RepID=UPI003CCCAC00
MDIDTLKLVSLTTQEALFAPTLILQLTLFSFRNCSMHSVQIRTECFNTTAPALIKVPRKSTSKARTESRLAFKKTETAAPRRLDAIQQISDVRLANKRGYLEVLATMDLRVKAISKVMVCSCVTVLHAAPILAFFLALVLSQGGA